MPRHESYLFIPQPGKQQCASVLYWHVRRPLLMILFSQWVLDAEPSLYVPKCEDPTIVVVALSGRIVAFQPKGFITRSFPFQNLHQLSNHGQIYRNITRLVPCSWPFTRSSLPSIGLLTPSLLSES